MGFYDYLLLAFYFAFIISIGVVFRHYSKDISDYFRGGGSMLWWMSGASALLGGLSVWSFTGAAAEVYDAGTLILVIYWSNALAGIFVWLFTSHRFRRMRVITPVQAIQRRYGSGTEQLYLWVQIPMALFIGGFGLNALGVFVASVFGANLIVTVLVVGLVVLFVACIGGAWAVVASDFIQMLLVLSVCLIVAFLTLRQPAIGGITGLVHKLPASRFNWAILEKPSVLVFWICAMVIQNFLFANDLSQGAAKFMSVKNESNARKAALMIVVVFLVLPFLLMIPPLASIILFPHLHQQFPMLRHPHEAAYVAVCIKVLPQGMLGLLVSAMFATAMAYTDVALNRNAGNFVQNFYQQYLRPAATDRELLLASRLFTVIFGVLIICIGLLIAVYRNMNLFNFAIVMGGVMLVPISIPMVLGLFIKRTPPWAGWSTILIGLSVSTLMNWGFAPDWLRGLFGGHHAYTPAERANISFAAMVTAEVLVSTTWFFLTRRFTDGSSPRYKQQVQQFFDDMNRSIDPVAENIAYDDARQYRVLGRLCLIYGSAVGLGALIPNAIEGRLCFLFVGGCLAGVGFFLLFMNRIMMRRAMNQPVVASGVAEIGDPDTVQREEAD